MLEKTLPNQNTVRVLHSFDGVVVVKPLAVLRPSHFGPGGPQALKHELIREHHLGPIFRGPVLIGLSRLEPSSWQ